MKFEIPSISNIISKPKRRFGKRIYRNVLLISILFVIPTLLYSFTTEYDVKAVFLKTISQYIQWPEIVTIEDKTQPFVIVVIGKNPFGSVLEDIYKNKKQKIKDRSVEIRYVEEIDQIGSCHMLFIAQSEQKYIEKILKSVNDQSVLILADSQGFGERGVHINFYTYQKSIKFELNEYAMVKAGFKVDYRLRNIAKIVGSRKQSKR